MNVTNGFLTVSFMEKRSDTAIKLYASHLRHGMVSNNAEGKEYLPSRQRLPLYEEADGGARFGALPKSLFGSAPIVNVNLAPATRSR
jgi:hypothetical protein